MRNRIKRQWGKFEIEVGVSLQEIGIGIIYTPPGRFRVFQFDLLIGPFYLWITR